jgi:hypothetical protein
MNCRACAASNQWVLRLSLLMVTVVAGPCARVGPPRLGDGIKQALGAL